MSDKTNSMQERRRVLKLLGGGAVLMPLTALQGCSGEKESTPSVTKPKADSLPAVKTSAAPAAKMKPAELPHLEESNPQAMALGYKHDASQVDKSKQAKYEAGQLCKNCTLYLSKDSSEWAGCSLFPGKAVNANGWCAAYVPMA